MSEPDPHCWTLACQAARGVMTWFDVFMFCFCALLIGAYLGYRTGRWVFATEVLALVPPDVQREARARIGGGR